jgi:hypothetical protein
MDIDRYKNIINLKPEFNEISIITHLPEPTDNDYKKGYIVRYFVQKANDINSPIYEIKQKAISKLSNNSFYITTSLDWRLVGPTDEVKKSNSASIRIASQRIPKLQLYLPNLLQFYKK